VGILGRRSKVLEAPACVLPNLGDDRLADTHTDSDRRTSGKSDATAKTYRFAHALFSRWRLISEATMYPPGILTKPGVWKNPGKSSADTASFTPTRKFLQREDLSTQTPQSNPTPKAPHNTPTTCPPPHVTPYTVTSLREGETSSLTELHRKQHGSRGPGSSREMVSGA